MTDQQLSPSSFLWGVSTSGHQTEGDNVDSDVWFLENLVPTVFAERSGKATNAWELWETDLDLVAGMNLNAYRFSVEWARVEPREGIFRDRVLDHYEAIIDGCVARGLTPIVTFNHFTLPHWFAAKGGWCSPDAARSFARYCAALMERFGDRIGYAVTFNEPNLGEMLEWAELPPQWEEAKQATLAAAAALAGVPAYRAGNVVLREDFSDVRAGITHAHEAAVAAIKARRPDLPVGLSLAMCDDVAEAGGEALRDRKRAEVYDYWLRLARSDDFVGVQNYERLVYGPNGLVPPLPGAVRNGGGTAVEPDSLREAVAWAHEVSGVPVLVTEHGISTPDDRIRVGFLRSSLESLATSVAGGLPVLGYCHWTLLDGYEWIFGYEPKLGLYSVDRETFTRTPKASAWVYRELVHRFRAASE